VNTPEKHLVENLTRSKVYRDYETAFRGATGLPLAFTPVETWGLPLHGDRNESPFCRILARTNKTCAACLRLQESLRKNATEAAATATCFSSLCDSAVPVKLGSRLVGFLHTGQIFARQPTEADFARTIATLASWGVAMNVSELRDAYFACNVVSPERYQAILRLLELFAEHLATVGNQILVTEESAENPQITRAREFIAQHLADDISLADCARTAHMSTFYFCKMFKRATGLSFTEYVSRLRTEKAKSLLLDPHMRVSEAAFEVGFQSLSQFNRSFKKVTGRSPTDYRHNLPAAASRSKRSHDGLAKSAGRLDLGNARRAVSRTCTRIRERFAVAAA